MVGEVIPYATNVQVSARQAHMLPQNLSDAARIAEYIAASGLFGCKTKEQAFSLMLLADAEGLHPAAAARDYHIIEGRPSLKADAMLARYMNAGGRIEWLCRTDEKVAAKFTHPSSGTVEVEWTIARAKKITRYNRKKGRDEPLTDNQNWKNYPRQMLSARVISEGVRMSFPAIVAGVYTPEEVQDFDEPAPVVSHRPVAQPATDPGAAALTEEGGETSSAPSSHSLRVSFTGDRDPDGLPKGKSAYAARKNGDWKRVSERLDEELRECATRSEAVIWWERVCGSDEEYRALPESWRKTYRDERYLPVLATLDDDTPRSVEWEDEPPPEER